MEPILSSSNTDSAVIYMLKFAASANPNQSTDAIKARELLQNQLNISDVRLVDLAAQFNKRQEVERATAGRKHYPIIYINSTLIGVRY